MSLFLVTYILGVLAHSLKVKATDFSTFIEQSLLSVDKRYLLELTACCNNKILLSGKFSLIQIIKDYEM